MFKSEFKFNMDDAMAGNKLPQYEFAYPITNEPIEQWLPLTPIKNPRVLTVAASGDQPLMYAAHGATHIDTFDITINSCAIMDFKTTAMQSMDYYEYRNNIANIIQLRHMNKHKHIFTQEYANLDKIVDRMPMRTQQLMHNIIHHNPAAFRSIFMDPGFLRYPDVYAHTQRNVKHPFNFIWADLMNITHHIGTKKYDIIYLSNIFNHYLIDGRDADDIFATLHNLWPHLADGGYILSTSLDYRTTNLFRQNQSIRKSVPSHATITALPTRSEYLNWTPIIIQKTR